MIHSDFSGCDNALAQTIAATGLVVGSKIATAQGFIPVEDIEEGAQVVTREFGMQIAVLRRHAKGRCRMVRITAHALGQDCPMRDIDMGADTLILMRPHREGMPPSLYQACDLIDGETVFDLGTQEVELACPVFEEGRVIYAEGLELVSTPV